MLIEREAKREAVEPSREDLEKASPEARWFVAQYRAIARDLAANRPTPATRKLFDAFPAGVAIAGIHTEEPSPRTEANALVAYCVRNGGPLEGYHAKGRPIGQAEMKELMVTSCRIAEAWLRVRDACLRHEPRVWWAWVNAYHRMYCGRWSMK